MTKQDIEGLQIGDRLEHTLDTAYGNVLPGARYSAARTVVEIFARGISIKGTAYVCFYTDFGPNSRISGSIGEGEQSYRFATPGRRRPMSDQTATQKALEGLRHLASHLQEPPPTCEPPWYDYDNQAWIFDGIYQRCGHRESTPCKCYGRAHQGEPPSPEILAQHDSRKDDRP